MPDQIMGANQVLWNINSSGAGLVTGSISVTTEPEPFDSHEQLTGLTGSPSVTTLVFTSGAVKTISVQGEEDFYIDFDKTATTNSMLLTGFQPYNADFLVGSVSILYKDVVGSVWAWGGR